MAVQKTQHDLSIDADWILTADQMIFMLQHHNLIETAYAEEDVEALHSLADSGEYRSIFGEMGWDEAFDRYETMIENAES